MCNSRNSSWRESIKPYLPFEALEYNLNNKNISFSMRAILCNLLNKMYIDQEERYMVVLPSLCKILDLNKSKPIEI
jgi:hypothetical protein